MEKYILRIALSRDAGVTLSELRYDYFYSFFVDVGEGETIYFQMEIKITLGKL